jgi:hypothetical protein
LKLRHHLVTLLALGTLALTGLPAHAQGAAVELPGGVKFAPTAQVAGTPLVLNGAGIRYKFVVKVYAAGLYMATKANNTAAALAVPGPKRVQVTMYRDIDANELGRLFTRGMQDNAPKDEFSRLIPGTIKLADIFSQRKKLLNGETFSVDFVPGQGTMVLVNGKQLGETIKEPEFFNAMLRIWLGDNPADNPLKDALLGRKVERSPGAQNQQ